MDNDIVVSETQDTQDSSQQQPGEQYADSGPRPKKHTRADDEPIERFFRLSSGALYDREAGHIVAMDNSLNPNAITVQNSQDYHLLRKERQLEAAIVAGNAIADELGAPTAVEAFGKIMRKQARIATNTDLQNRLSTQAARFVGEVTGFVPSYAERQAANSPPAGGNILDALPTAFWRACIEYVRDRQDSISNEG